METYGSFEEHQQTLNSELHDELEKNLMTLLSHEKELQTELIDLDRKVFSTSVLEEINYFISLLNLHSLKSFFKLQKKIEEQKQTKIKMQTALLQVCPFAYSVLFLM